MPAKSGERRASSPRSTTFKPRFQYAVKFLCTSNLPGTSQTSSSVLPGNYQTAVNIHNPTEETILVRSKIVFGPRKDAISKWAPDRVIADALLHIDCSSIRSKYAARFIHGWEGFLVIQSSDTLDVVAVYTAGPQGQGVASIDVQQVRERALTL